MMAGDKENEMPNALQRFYDSLGEMATVPQKVRERVTNFFENGFDGEKATGIATKDEYEMEKACVRDEIERAFERAERHHNVVAGHDSIYSVADMVADLANEPGSKIDDYTPYIEFGRQRVKVRLRVTPGHEST